MQFPEDVAIFLLGIGNQILFMTFSGSPDIENHLRRRKSNALTKGRSKKITH